MYEGISLRVPAKESALTVVRLTTAGAAAQGCPDFETLEDFKTAVYEACYAMTKQKVTPEELLIEYAPGEVFSVSVRGCGARRETGGPRSRPEALLCRFDHDDPECRDRLRQPRHLLHPDAPADGCAQER